MTMKRIAIAAAMLFATCSAQAQIYQWQDENNKTVISDRPPVGKVRQPRQIAAEAAAPGDDTGKTLADREMEFRKRQKESQEGAAEARKEQHAAAQRHENCERARLSLRVLESGERVSMRDSKGERYYLDDRQREQEIERARNDVQANCK